MVKIILFVGVLIGALIYGVVRSTVVPLGDDFYIYESSGYTYLKSSRDKSQSYYHVLHYKQNKDMAIGVIFSVDHPVCREKGFEYFIVDKRTHNLEFMCNKKSFVDKVNNLNDEKLLLTTQEESSMIRECLRIKKCANYYYEKKH